MSHLCNLQIVVQSVNSTISHYVKRDVMVASMPLFPIGQKVNSSYCVQFWETLGKDIRKPKNGLTRKWKLKPTDRKQSWTFWLYNH